jgi:hypothetical protein
MTAVFPPPCYATKHHLSTLLNRIYINALVANGMAFRERCRHGTRDVLIHWTW